MKTDCRFILPILLALVAPAPGVDFIRQIQLIEGQALVYDMPVAGVGGQVLSKPLEGEGAIFQLYAYEDHVYSPFSLLDVGVGTLAHANVSLGSHLLDVSVLGIHLDIHLGGDDGNDVLPQRLAEISVGTHLPQAVLQLSSEDPYDPPRTRADQPYALRLALRNLAAPDDPQGGISRVVMERDYKLYHPVLHAPAPNGSGQGGYDGAFEFHRNGDFNDAAIYQELPVDRPTKASGEESFSVLAPLGSGQKARIASATIQIWPVCEGVIEGLEEGRKYLGLPPDAKAVLKDLYPDSVTFAQIYKGPAELGRAGKIIPSAIVSYNTYAPQNAVLALSGIGEEIDEDGTYTVEVLTATPFNQRRPERVTHVTFEVKRTLHVRGFLGSVER